MLNFPEEDFLREPAVSLQEVSFTIMITMLFSTLVAPFVSSPFTLPGRLKRTPTGARQRPVATRQI